MTLLYRKYLWVLNKRKQDRTRKVNVDTTLRTHSIDSKSITFEAQMMHYTSHSCIPCRRERTCSYPICSVIFIRDRGVINPIRLANAQKRTLRVCSVHLFRSCTSFLHLTETTFKKIHVCTCISVNRYPAKFFRTSTYIKLQGNKNQQRHFSRNSLWFCTVQFKTYYPYPGS